MFMKGHRPETYKQCLDALLLDGQYIGSDSLAYQTGCQVERPVDSFLPTRNNQYQTNEYTHLLLYNYDMLREYIFTEKKKKEILDP